MFQITTSDAANLWHVWGKALPQLPEENMRFALNSAVDTLPHNVNLCLWKRRGSEACPLCGEWQTLIHVLYMCPVAVTSRRFNFCHDSVLQKIASTISQALPATAKMTSDLSSYTFPHHIVQPLYGQT